MVKRDKADPTLSAFEKRNKNQLGVMLEKIILSEGGACDVSREQGE